MAKKNRLKIQSPDEVTAGVTAEKPTEKPTEKAAEPAEEKKNITLSCIQNLRKYNNSKKPINIDVIFRDKLEELKHVSKLDLSTLINNILKEYFEKNGDNISNFLNEYYKKKLM